MKRGRKRKDANIEKSKYDGHTKEIKDKMEVIDKILALYPDLKKDKTNIITTVLGQKKNVEEKEKILIEFTHNGCIYYRSKLGEIFDENANLVGTVKNNEKDEFTFFNQMENILDNL